VRLPTTRSCRPSCAWDSPVCSVPMRFPDLPLGV